MQVKDRALKLGRTHNVAVDTLVSVNVGVPKDVAWHGEAVFTGAWKDPVAGEQMVRRLNIDGDGQGDLAGHGGEHRAVLVYQLGSYDYWQQFLGRSDFTYGQFGENFTVDGLGDDEVCIGDRLQIGEALFEVTQPRVTCYRLGMRMAEPRMAALLVGHHRPGFYLRVLSEGVVAAGDPIVHTRSGEGQVSVAEASALLYLPDRDPERLAVAVAIPALSEGWRGSFRDLLAPPAQPVSGWSGFRPLRVSRVQDETDEVRSLYFADPEATTAPLPGQYLTVRVPAESEQPSIRSYSVSGFANGEYRISVKREAHGLVSAYLHDVVAAGATVEIASPRGEFVLADGVEPVLLISAGIGSTPVFAMLAELARMRSAREVWWIHVARDSAHHVFATQVSDLLRELVSGRVRTYLTSTEGRPGVDALRELGISPAATAYLCGPEAFMSEMRQALIAIGLAADSIHTETFGARGAINPGVVATEHPPPHPPAGPPGEGPLVTFARSGLAAPWPQGRQHTVLEFAESCDVPTQWSCRTGVCHTCSTAVLSGRANYVIEPLDRAPAGELLICCAVPVEDLVLDL
jgi:ferredoxin-NADP reductase/MOSC domain-containing protein YiiM